MLLRPGGVGRRRFLGSRSVAVGPVGLIDGGPVRTTVALVCVLLADGTVRSYDDAAPCGPVNDRRCVDHTGSADGVATTHSGTRDGLGGVPTHSRVKRVTQGRRARESGCRLAR